MTIVPTIDTPFNEWRNLVRLARYAQRIGYPECQFWGVWREDNILNYQCRDIWLQSQRNDIAFYLAEAQEEIEHVTGFPLFPTWVSHDNDNWLFRDDQSLVLSRKGVLQTRWNYLLKVGIRDPILLGEDVVVDHTNDPAIIGPIVANIQNVEDVVIYHPDSDIEIVPSSLTYNGTNLLIEIPRCRMVKLENQLNPEDGWDYSDLAIFESVVDVYEIRTNPSTQATFVHDTCNCVIDTTEGCIRIINAKFGLIRVELGTGCGCGGNRVWLNYKAGLIKSTPQAEDTVIRLAHSKMPEEPCGCEIVQHLWRRDRAIPEVISSERAANPFGLSNGAWIAWRFANAQKVWRQGILGI